MQMTDTEILVKYNRSDDKKGMVQILADLNGCDKDTIQQILIQGGVPESEFTPKKRRKKPSPAVKEPEYKEAPAGKPDPAKATAAMPPEDMTDKERKRLERIKAIPESVRELCQTEVANLRSQVMELEKRSDEIIDFLNGEEV